MTRDRSDALSRVEAELRGVRRSRARACLSAWSEAYPPLRDAGLAGPAEVPAWAWGLSTGEADELVRALVGFAQGGDEVALLAVVACLRPGLCALVGRIGVPMDEVVPELVVVTLGFPLARRRSVAGQLLLDTRKRFQRQREKVRDIPVGDTRSGLERLAAPGDLGAGGRAAEDAEAGIKVRAEPHTAVRTVLRTVDDGRYDDGGWDYRVNVFAGHRVVASDGREVSFRYGDNPAVPNKNTSRGPELLSYLALRPGRSATTDEVRDHLWWGRPVGGRTVTTLISGTRRVLGGTAYLSHAEGAPGRREYTLGSGVVTDVELIARAVAEARATAANASADALAALCTVLAEVEGPAFVDGHLGSGLAEWAAANRVVDHVEQPVIEAALLAAELAESLGPAGRDAALDALDHALAACPTNEAIVRAAMALDAEAGNRDRANARYVALATQLTRDDLEPETETTDLRVQIMRPNSRIG